MQELDHKHLVVTAAIKNPPKTTEQIEAWLLKVVEAVDMKVFMEPRASRCDTVGNEGVTGVVGLETSHASIHVWESAAVPFLKFDIYSCKRFDPQSVLDCMMEFEPYFFQTMLIDRNDVISIADQYDIQVVSIIDLLPLDVKQHYLSAHRRKKGETQTKEEKSARALYTKLSNKFSVKSRKRSQKYVDNHMATLTCIKSRANKKNLDFDLTTEWYETALSDAKKKWPKLTKHGSEDSFWRANVDQIKAGFGYTQSNCRIIPQALNVAKWKWHNKEVEELTLLLVEEHSSNPEFLIKLKSILDQK